MIEYICNANFQKYGRNQFAPGIIVFFFLNISASWIISAPFLYLQLCSSTFPPHPALSVPLHQKTPVKMLDLLICFSGITFIQSSTFQTLKTALTLFSPSPPSIFLVFIVGRSIPMCLFLTPSFSFLP